MNKLDGWVLAWVGNMILIGAKDGMLGVAGRLRPVYEIKPVMRQTRQDAAILHAVFPIALLSSLDSIDLPANCLVVQVDSLSHTERRSLAAGVEHAEAMVREMRAAEAGVILAPAGAKLP
jgi:hypothetical protein